MNTQASALRFLFTIAAQKDQVVRLQQAPIFRTQGSIIVPVALHAPGCHLEQAPDRRGQDRRHLQIQGLPHRGTGPLQDHDA